MPSPIVCDIEDIVNQIGPATLTGQTYTPVDIVLRSVKPPRNGFPVIVFSLYGESPAQNYEAEWGNTEHMWIPCPSTFPADAAFVPPTPGDPPLPNAWGRLYMTSAVLLQNGIAAMLEPKWPPKLASQDPIARTLDLYPTRIVLSGLELRTGELREATIDLLDPMQASVLQTLELDGTKPVRLRLTQASFNRFTLPFTPEREPLEEAPAAQATPLVPTP
jgi:hypothetical protein